MPLEITRRSHAFGEVEPKVGMWRRFLTLPVRTFLVTHIRQHGAAKFAVLKTKPEGSEIRGKCFYVVIIVLGVFTEIFTRESSGGPGFVKGMAEQLKFGDAGIQLLEKLGGRHTLLVRLGACQPTIRARSMIGK